MARVRWQRRPARSPARNPDGRLLASQEAAEKFRDFLEKARRTAKKFPILMGEETRSGRMGGDDDVRNGKADPGDEITPATMTAPGGEPRGTTTATTGPSPQIRHEARGPGRRRIPAARPVPSGGAGPVRPGRIGPGEMGSPSYRRNKADVTAGRGLIKTKNTLRNPRPSP